MSLRAPRWLVLILVVGACERPPAERANDTAIPETTLPVPPPVVVPVESAWDTAAGAVFLIMGATPGQGALVIPSLDTTASLDTVRMALTPWRGRSVDLVYRGGILGTATLGDSIPVEAPEECSAWPAIRLNRADTTTWSVAFVQGRFAPLSYDTLGALSPRDSAGLTRDLARVASAAPGDTAEAMRGLPYVVHRAWRTTLPSGRQAVLAEIDRTLPQEATPLHEHLLLVMERGPESGARWELAWSERTVGGEESSGAIDLEAVGLPRGRTEPVLLFARYLGDGVTYALLQRDGDRRWRLRWVSPYVGC